MRKKIFQSKLDPLYMNHSRPPVPELPDYPNSDMMVEIVDNELIVKLKLFPPTLATSGKCLLVARSEGFEPTQLKIDGKQVFISISAFINK